MNSCAAALGSWVCGGILVAAIFVSVFATVLGQASFLCPNELQELAHLPLFDIVFGLDGQWILVVVIVAIRPPAQSLELSTVTCLPHRVLGVTRLPVGDWRDVAFELGIIAAHVHALIDASLDFAHRGLL